MTANDLSAYPVDTPITDGVFLVNFFNGRLLAAEDLARERQANEALRERLGLGIGDGVVRGLRVRLPTGVDPAQPVVEVSAGVAINRRGAALALATGTRLTLARADTTAPAAAVRDFAACSGLADRAPLTVSGVYLLTVAPAQRPVGRAPVSGLGNDMASCNTDGSAEGVQFRLLHLTLDPALLADTAHLRNRLACLMFGVGDARRDRLERDPFGAGPAGYGLLDDLRAICLTDDEVPLACLLWTPGVGIGFVDEWSVRRRPVPGGPDPDWTEASGQRRLAEGEAAFLQFQAELADLAGGTAGPPTAVAARDRFTQLPAAGLVPLATSRWTRGFDVGVFFTGLATRPATAGADPIYLPQARVEALLRRSFGYPPLDTSTGEFLWQYLVPANVQIGQAAQPYVLFAGGHLPYEADARFDLSYFDYANYALDRA